MTASLRTVQAVDASAAATKDRAATADLVLELAVKEARDLIRMGRTGAAEFRMVRAGMAAERILGRPS